MASKFFAITLNCGARSIPNDAIEAALGRYDWLRWSRDTYFAYTFGVEPRQIFDLLKPLLHADDLILVIEVDRYQRYGWASPIAVEWFSKARV